MTSHIKKSVGSSEPKFCNVTISVLGYHEDGEWVALALELDLRGYGDTFEDAIEDLNSQVEMQISFAEFKDEADMIFHPAEATYFSLYAQVRYDMLRSLVSSKESSVTEYQVAGIPIPDAHIIHNLKDKFSQNLDA
ncbi:MAG TPA: hypothetical protein ENG78_02045 [Acidiferrobacteraceae bacterium]|nr:hypothetical protein [Acidiferrobacteraceae bacterium]HEX19589.1 hypothetical protein [Acidiferrobacteraceae bacterium]